LPRRALRSWIVTLVATATAVLSATPASAAILYSNNYNSEQLASFSIGADGLLTPVPGSPFTFSHVTEGFSITPDGRVMVESFGFDSLAGSYALSPGGNITPAQAPIGPGGFGVPAISPDGQFVYIPSAPGGTIAYRLGTDGSMTKIGGPFGSADGETPAITTDGRFLFMPSYSDGTIERFAIQPTGTLTPLGATPVGIEGPLVVRVTPDGRFAVLLVDTNSGIDYLRSFAIEADGSLTEVGAPVETTGDVSGPPVISPNGKFVYKTDGNEQSVSAYTIGPSGALAPSGSPTPTGLSQPDGVGMSTDGRFLYVEPMSGEKIQAFSVATDGSLTKIGALTPTGGFSDGVTLVALPAVPTAMLAAPTPVAPGQNATFNASGSSDVGAALTGYSWDFGDGTKLDNAGAGASHVFKKAGIYKVTVTAHDDAGCTGFVFTGQTPYCNGRGAKASVTLDTLPAILGMTVTSPKTKPTSSSRRKKPKRGAIHYKLSEDANVTFTVLSKRKGHKDGKTCKPTKGKGKKANCTLLRNIGSFSAGGKAGKNKAPLPGRLKGHPLRPGSYLLSAAATDSAGGSSTPRTAEFKVKKPKKHRR
jgi:6-phosphogluconolactonase (cycloisomerase 2 family)